MKYCQVRILNHRCNSKDLEMDLYVFLLLSTSKQLDEYTHRNENYTNFEVELIFQDCMTFIETIYMKSRSV